MLLVCREEGLAVKSGRERLGQRGGDTKLALWMSIGVHIGDLWAMMLFRTGCPIASVTNRKKFLFTSSPARVELSQTQRLFYLLLSTVTSSSAVHYCMSLCDCPLNLSDDALSSQGLCISRTKTSRTSSISLQTCELKAAFLPMTALKSRL